MSSAKSSVPLLDGEVVIFDAVPSKFGTLPHFVGSLGFWAIWRARHRFILTNMRIVVRKGIINRHETAVPLGRVQDVSIRTIPFVGEVRLSSAGGPMGIERIGPLKPKEAQEWCDRILEMSSGRSDDGLSSSATSMIATELAQLAQLRDNNVLTQEEFDQQKAKLLAR